MRLGGNIYEIPNRSKSPIKYFNSLKNIVKKNNYNIIHAHGNSGTLLLDIYASKLGGANIRISHCHNSTCTHKFIHKITKSGLNKNATTLLACSNVAGKWLYDKDFEIINNGIEFEKFSFNEEVRKKYRDEMGLSEYFVLGHVGHISYQKNHEFLLEIFKEILKINPKSKLVLIGDGILRTEIENKIRKLKIENDVILMGKRSDISNILCMMDIFIFPSRFEGLPVALLEAQATGLQCITSTAVTEEANVLGNVKYLNLEESPEIWANKILECNKNYPRNYALEIFKKSKFNIDNEVKKLEELYLNGTL